MNQTIAPFLFVFAIGSALSAQDSSLADLQTKFATADQQLNAVYQEAMKTIPEWRIDDVKQEQREWLEFRDLRAEQSAILDGGAEAEAVKSAPEYWTSMTDSTLTRVTMLQAWMAIDSYTEEWQGVWQDGEGGWLGIIEQEDGLFDFAFEVVRGPTYHLGQIAGQAKWLGTTARFAITAEGADEETWITFLKENGRVKVVAENASYFLGARAYFDGTYLRTGAVTEDDRESILNPPTD
jgi:uncharacterized protein YecT (DUF1311 family)